jgi:hypothetical protein
LGQEADPPLREYALREYGSSIGIRISEIVRVTIRNKDLRLQSVEKGPSLLVAELVGQSHRKRSKGHLREQRVPMGEGYYS